MEGFIRFILRVGLEFEGWDLGVAVKGSRLDRTLLHCVVWF